MAKLKQCPVCSTTYPDDAVYCDKEGAKLVSGAGQPAPSPGLKAAGASQPATAPPTPTATAKCKACGWSGPAPPDGYCPNCGIRLETAGAAPAPSQQPAGPTLELVFSDSTKIELNTFPSKLGRDALKRYPNSEFVSQAHLSIYYESGQFQIEDTNSLNGTSLNGKVIGKGRNNGGGLGKHPLKDGDTISLAGPFNDKGQGAITFNVKVIQPASKQGP